MAKQWLATLKIVVHDDAMVRRSKLNRPEVAAGLRNSQVAWLRYRDAECYMIGDQGAGGTGAGDLFSRCMIQLNRQRTKDLANRANGRLIPD